VAVKPEAREKQTDTGVEVEHTHNKATITKGKDEIHVESHVFALRQAGEVVTSEKFTRDTFEDALDRVSRPVKGKYAHVPYSSEDLIREKRTETELEDR
jgi:hypothetical protein